MPTGKKRVYLLVILLGGVALFVDRVVLTESVTYPSEASAVPRRPTPTSAAPSGTPQEPGSDMSVPELPFPRGLPRWDGRSPIRDVFSPAGVEPDNTEPFAHDGHTAPGTCAAFSTGRRLDAVFVQERLRIAVVNGHRVKLGEVVDGCTLVEVEGNKVRFRCRDGETTLRLNPAASSP